MSSYYRQQLETYLKTLDVAGDVVDVGGKQKTIKGRTKTWNVQNYTCLDVPEYDLNLSQPSNYPGAAAGSFDLAFCLEVFEYLLIPTVAIQNIYQLLKPGGKAIISFAFIYPLHNEVEFDTLRFTETGVKRLAEYAGFKIENIIKRRPKTPTLLKYYQEDGMRAAKGHDHNVTGFIAEMIK